MARFFISGTSYYIFNLLKGFLYSPKTNQVSKKTIPLDSDSKDLLVIPSMRKDATL